MEQKKMTVSRLLIGLVLFAFSAVCIIPILAIVSISFSNESDIVRYGYRLLPAHWSLDSFAFIFKNPSQIVNGYKVSISVTLIGTVTALFLQSMMGYVLSRNDFKLRKLFTFLVVFTMLFNGGLVPTYMVIVNSLHLKNNFWVLVLPYLVNAWYIILLKSYFATIPASLMESARIDGAGEFRILFQIVYPLSKPALATVGLFLTLIYWNDWWLSMLYIEKQSLLSLQYLLARMMRDLSELLQSITELPAGMTMRDFPNESARMAMCLLAAGPMLFIFPFFQKFFIKGLTVGAVKE